MLEGIRAAFCLVISAVFIQVQTPIEDESVTRRSTDRRTTFGLTHGEVSLSSASYSSSEKSASTRGETLTLRQVLYSGGSEEEDPPTHAGFDDGLRGSWSAV